MEKTVLNCDPKSHRRRVRPASIALTGLLLSTLLAGGCASAGKGGGGVIDKTLQAVGIRDKAADAAPKAQRVKIRMYPGDNLNAANDRRPIALVVRVYHLRSIQRFEQLPYDTFLDPDRERTSLGDDLVSVNEIVLRPGKQHDIEEQLAAETGFVGVVGLFRAPATNRWRFAFDGHHKSVADGITVGLHACAMTTTSPALLSRLPDDPASLVSVRCQAAPR